MIEPGAADDEAGNLRDVSAASTGKLRLGVVSCAVAERRERRKCRMRWTRSIMMLAKSLDLQQG